MTTRRVDAKALRTTEPPTTTTTKTTQHRNVYTIACIVVLAALAQLAAAEDAPHQQFGGQRYKRMYAMCPPNFVRISQRCYYISETSMNWLDAHFDCKDRNSQLAEPGKLDDRKLRKYMQKNDTAHTLKWIGGVFNWQQNQWQWGYSGRNMEYQSFSQMLPGISQDLKFHCAVLNSALKYRWSAKPCVEKHNFVCQHNMPYVNEKNKYKVYARWNATFPNELANEEVEMIMDDPKGGYPRLITPPRAAVINGNQHTYNKMNITAQPTGSRQWPRKRKQHIFNNTMLDTNGRFADRKLSQSVNFGAPHRGVSPLRRRRPKTTTTTTTTPNTHLSTAGSDTNSPDFNRIDGDAEARHQQDKKAAEDKQRLESREKHKRTRLERQQRILARKEANALRRKQEHERLMLEQSNRQSEEREREQRTQLTSMAPMTEEQKREEQRLAEARRVLGIEDGRRPKHHFHDNGVGATTQPSRTSQPTARTTTTSTTPATTSTTTTTTTLRTVDPVDNNIDSGDADDRREQEERRIRDEEERQRMEFERRRQEYQQQQEDYERQDRLNAEQAERDRIAQQAERDRREREQLEQEERIQTEIRERKERERIEEETLQRDLQKRRVAEEQRKRAKELQRQERLQKVAEIQRLKEKSVAHTNETAELPSAEQLALEVAEKKRKRDRIHEKLKNMTEEQRQQFMAMRAERQKKRQTTNEAAIPQ